MPDFISLRGDQLQLVELGGCPDHQLHLFIGLRSVTFWFSQDCNREKLQEVLMTARRCGDEVFDGRAEAEGVAEEAVLDFRISVRLCNVDVVALVAENDGLQYLGDVSLERRDSRWTVVDQLFLLRLSSGVAYANVFLGRVN